MVTIQRVGMVFSRTLPISLPVEYWQLDLLSHIKRRADLFLQLFHEFG